MSEVEGALSKLAETLSDLLCCNENQKMISSNCYSICGSSHPTYGLLCPDLVDNDIITLRQTLEYEIGQMLGSTSETAENWVTLVQDWLCSTSSDSSSINDENRCDNRSKSTLLNRSHYAVNNYQKRRRQFQTSVEPPPRACHLSSASAYYRDVHESLFTRSFDDISHDKNNIGTYFASSNSVGYGENVICYDSDPEMYSSGHPTKKSTNFRIKSQKSKEDLSTCSSSKCIDKYSCCKEDDDRSFIDKYSCCKEDDDSSFATFCSSVGDDESSKSSLCYGVTYSYDDDTSIAFQTLINENLTLVYHPSTAKESKTISPICVTAWIEMGSCLKKQLIQPKFMWREAYSNCNNTNKQQYQNPNKKRHSSYTYQPPTSIELLSIVRVLKPDTIDRTQHPFAKLSNSFTLHDSNDSVYLFEAQTTEECDRLVYGLKIVIARLASKIIIGDDNVFGEFFTSFKGTT